MTALTLPVTLTPLLGIPEVRQGDDIAALMLTALQHNKIQLLDGDILVISSKVVSKAMGLRAPASAQAEVVLSQTVRIVAERLTPAGVTRIVESAAGPVMTAAGVDASNTDDQSEVLILPADPDAVAVQIRSGIQDGWVELSGRRALIGVVLSDTAGRPWRNGQTDFALGASGLRVIDDLRGSTDAGGRMMSVTQRCIADEVAAAADLVKGKATGVAAAHIRGLGHYLHGAAGQHGDPTDSEPDSGARDLVRTGRQDWFGYGMVEAVRSALGVEPGSAAAHQVGIPFIVPEDSAIRAARALRVALLSCPEVTGKLDGDAITLRAPDDFSLGVAAARTEVALRGERLATTLARSPDATGAAGHHLTAPVHVIIVFQ